MPKMGTGVWSRTLPIPVLRPGARAAASSFVFAYSNSKAAIRNPIPAENPLTDRLDGVMLAPTNSVASASAGLGVAAISRAVRRVVRTAVRTGYVERVIQPIIV